MVLLRALARLKDKLGNVANASAEIEGAWAEMLGEPGDGVRAILHMVTTRASTPPPRPPA